MLDKARDGGVEKKKGGVGKAERGQEKEGRKSVGGREKKVNVLIKQRGLGERGNAESRFPVIKMAVI